MMMISMLGLPLPCINDTHSPSLYEPGVVCSSYIQKHVGMYLIGDILLRVDTCSQKAGNDGGVGWIDGPWVGVVVSIAGARLVGLEHNSRREKGEGQKRKSVL